MIYKNMEFALVTGGSRGIGRAIALELARRGMPVIINYLSNTQAAEQTKAEIEALGVTAELMQFDTASPEAIEKALEQWAEAHPDDYIQVLVNNAGVRRDNLMIFMHIQHNDVRHIEKQCHGQRDSDADDQHGDQRDVRCVPAGTPPFSLAVLMPADTCFFDIPHAASSFRLFFV